MRFLFGSVNENFYSIFALLQKNGYIMNLIYLKKVLKVMMNSEKEFERQKGKYPH